MTASAHYNYNRRNSSATPYTIPTKHQPQHQHQSPMVSSYQVHHHQHSYNPQTRQHTSYQPSYSQESAISSPPLSASVPTLSREFVVRRISEGETGRLKEELRCEACGKGYKHISSLAKHLWEHTPEWNVTKKLLISKHQQVQLLEAASILVGMNENNANGTAHSAYHARTFSDQYNNAPPYSPPSTSHTSDTSTTPTISHSNNQDFNGDQEQGIQFRNGYHHNEYEGEEYDDYEGQKRMDYGRSRSVSHEPPTNHSNVNGTSPMVGPTNGNKFEKSLKSPTLSYINNSEELPVKTNFSIVKNKVEIDDILDKRTDSSSDEEEEDEVIGKMED
ncbi:hypothetical protein L150_00657 [Candida albicans Ca529L]|nr:hypothetical protein L150_00657 [Candida albicans Ca529L]